MRCWFLVFLLFSQVSGEDGIEALAALLEKHRAIPPITATIVSSKFVVDPKDGELINAGKNELVAMFGASRDAGSRYHFDPHQTLWRDGLAPFNERKVTYAFGNEFWAKIIDEEGPIGKVRPKKYAEVRFKPSLDDEINRWETGDGFLLLRQMVFDTISILDLEKLSKYKITVESEGGLTKVFFERQRLTDIQRDGFFVSPEKGYALVGRLYELKVRDKIDPRFSQIKTYPPGSLIVQSKVEIEKLQPCGDGFLPIDSKIEVIAGDGQISSRIASKIVKWDILDEDINQIPLSIPSGYIVNDLRSGESYKVGAKGPKLIEKNKKPE